MGPVPGARRSIRRPNRRPVTTKATLEQRRWTVAGLLVGLVLVYGYGFARLVAIGVIQS
jgi:hypothetical protein